MKRTIQKKLTLNKETLHNLSEREMQGANGGATFTGFCCSGGNSSCCTDSCTSHAQVCTGCWQKTRFPVPVVAANLSSDRHVPRFSEPSDVASDYRP